MKDHFSFLKRIKVRIALSFSLLFLIVAVPAIIYAFGQVNMFFEGLYLQQMKIAGLAAGSMASPNIDHDSLTYSISRLTATGVFLLGSDGKILSHSSEEPLADSASLLAIPIERGPADTLDQTLHRFVKIANRRYLKVQATMPDGNRLLMVKPFSRVSMLKARMREVIFWTSFLGLVALIAVAFWVSANITKPLEKLTAQAGKIRLGGFPEKTDIKSPDEVGELAEALNGVVDNLNRAKFDLLRLEKTQRDFYSGIGKRLEQPLITIQNQLSSIINSVNSIDRDTQNSLNMAIAQSRKIWDIIHTLIEISQLEYGEISLNPTTVSLAKLIESVTEKYRIEAERKGLLLELKYEPCAAAAVADAKYLKVAIENLISNAIAFTDEGYVKIYCEENGPLIAVRIDDSGRGIPQDQIDRIFERFYRVESSDADDRAGLGLVLAKEIIRAHGQELKVESRLGVGSHFSFCLEKPLDLFA